MSENERKKKHKTKIPIKQQQQQQQYVTNTAILFSSLSLHWLSFSLHNIMKKIE